MEDLITQLTGTNPMARNVRRIYYYIIIGVFAAGVVFYLYNNYINRPMFALELDPTKDITDISGIQYRIRITNIGQNELTGIVVNLGSNDIQNLSSLQPGQTYFFYPKPDTVPNMIRVSTSEGLHIMGDYRSPTKVLGLPGAGR
jgi:hypothetical protein